MRLPWQRSAPDRLLGLGPSSTALWVARLTRTRAWCPMLPRSLPAAPAAAVACPPTRTTQHSQEAAADRVEREAKGFGNVNSRQGRRNRKRKAQRAVAAEAEAEAAKIAEDDDDDDEVDSDEAEAEAEPKKKKMKVVAVRDTKGIDADTVMRVGPRGKVLNLDELTWVCTKSGVKWIDVQVGEGPQRPVKNRMVMLHYTGYLEFGTPGEKVFDSSEGAANFDNFFGPFLTDLSALDRPTRAVYVIFSTWCPSVLDASWCPQSNVNGMTNSHLQAHGSPSKAGGSSRRSP